MTSVLEWDVGMRGIVRLGRFLAECITARGEGGGWVGVEGVSNAVA